MKLIYVMPRILTFSLFLILMSCGKGEDPIDKSNFYRLNAYEVGVQPQARMVQILFQVTDYEHKGVAGLTEDDFIVTENGGRIDSEANLKIDPESIPYSLKTVLLLDVSRSVEGFVPQIKEACISLINQKLDHQEIAIYTFDSQTTLLQDFTTDAQALASAIGSIPEEGLVNSTNLYGAVVDVADQWEDSYSIESITDGSILIFTDGRHNATQAITLADATAATNGKKVFVAALNSVDLDESALQTLSREEDRYFKAEEITSLENMFLNIQTEIINLSNSIYYMFYQSPITDPTPFNNELKVEVRGNTNPEADRQIVKTFSSEGFGN